MTSRIRNMAATLCCVVAVALAGSPAAQAAQTPRSLEWPLDYFHADQVWQHGAGQGVTVAVVDTGVDAKHPDLAGQVDPGASFGGAGTDGTTDVNGHGTAMASYIAGTGRGYHGQGIKGLAFQARILAIANSNDESVSSSNSASAIRYAADHGAKVVNVSSGGPGDAQVLRIATAYAISRDVVVVAAAGNSGNKNNQVEYPAADPGVIAVAGTNQDGQPWPKSQYGPQVVLAAPAADQESADPDGYSIGNGTSASTAWVSATAAILRGMHPDWTAGQTIRQLIATAHKPDGSTGRDDHYGYGIVDPLAAVTTPLAAGPTTNPLLAANPPTTTNPGASDTAPSKQNTVAWAAGGVALVVLLIGGILVAVLAAKRRQTRRPAVNSWPAAPPPPNAWPQPPPPPKPGNWPPGPTN